jgi:flagellar basal-body rod protein FlgB
MEKVSLDSIVDTMKSVLDRSSVRAGVVASNLANIDTPGYRAMDVSFDEALNDAGLAPMRTDAQHLAGGGLPHGGRTHEVPSTRIRNDGNTVDIDKQMTLLAKLQGRYTTASQLIRKRFGLLIYTITSNR